MRHPILVSLCVAGAFALSACEQSSGNDVDRAFQDINVVDETNLNDVMLTASDPNEAVAYFQRSVGEKPDRIDLLRGLGQSLVRAKRNTEAVSIWTRVTEHKDATDEDRVDLADALIRNNEWDRAKTALDSIPPTHETFKRYRLEAMVADSKQNWTKADSFYEIAVGLTTQPASVMNNWGYSKLTRGDYPGAERLFTDAVRQDPALFTAKNNLVLARGAQRNYSLPVLPVSQTERAQLLYTLGLSAIKQGDTAIGEGLLRDAVETHPQHFEDAVRSLRALETKVAG
ncbi:Tetratricopeptide repeat protein [Roseovarius sp. EC-HK134]|uniref:Tetratricopeptide repeat protein n=1 Tax=Roseovarius mucosus TaxID=215743 RepID=A0A1V0RM65_9RHOB|nr:MULTISPECIES: tetratricopeptide repeat protein [Roseovarius]ARE82869.1 tetratricopeptide repeat protein [Roseovarius mucosus]VVT02631.1 Tetratricopeptide repeat protein [Roseovarius sp. EC-HK134]VVT03287.1 Tetratricopeptide repeat protein [Roseovarius sp. EC-SD190]|tara:strand:- start:2568 stop:3425 length:858 start_codon:yes stop_codon:yes gene_type:complete